MLEQPMDLIENCLKTHSQSSNYDSDAISTLEFFLRANGRINTSFAKGDKWPNIDGTFEYVTNPEVSRRPTHTFIVQIKGTHTEKFKDNVFKFSLNDLAFPAYIACNVTLDPGILFVVLNSNIKGSERVFWKYISVEFINSIDFSKKSVTINFSDEEEILNTYESVNKFCTNLDRIIARHLFVNQLSATQFNKEGIFRIIQKRNRQIMDSIETAEILNNSRDDVSQQILCYLEDLCKSALLLNSIQLGCNKPNLKLAWEQALTDIKTKYLATFMKGLRYIDNRIPDDGQSERLLLKYYNFMWQIRQFLYNDFKIYILENLEKFPLNIDKIDEEYYKKVADAIDKLKLKQQKLGYHSFYIQRKMPFFVGKERYYELTLRLASAYSPKYNRITVYTKENISTDYAIKVGYIDTTIDLWAKPSTIKVITNWCVSINPTCMNKLGKILDMPMNLSSKYGEYNALMTFLTSTGMNLLDLIDLEELNFSSYIEEIYKNTNTDKFKEILLWLKENFSKNSNTFGKHTIRYLLINLKYEQLNEALPNKYSSRLPHTELNLSKKCLPFEHNPLISNFAGSRTNSGNITRIINVVGMQQVKNVRPYLKIRKSIKETGEIYFKSSDIATDKEIRAYNNCLDTWERKQGYNIKNEDGYVSIISYEKTTLSILKKLLSYSHKENRGQKELNNKFIKDNQSVLTEKLDHIKIHAIQNVFINSRILLIYGAAGTGKTTLINYISNLMSNSKKLFLTKTHTAKQNLKRRIDNPGTDSDFVSIDSFTKKVSLNEYEIIFVDECSTIDNRTMDIFLNKVNMNTFLVFAGDINQIESIDFGNWFYYAKEIINTQGAKVELLDNWRTKEENLLSLWNEVRNNDGLITEKLAIDGPFSENISSNIFAKDDDDEVVLCLNYDGKFGLNSINSYFQNANPSGEPIMWQEWSYKKGDRILFNDNMRFTYLYNNLKGTIIDIKKTDMQISFTIDVETILTERECARDEIEFIDVYDETTRIRLTIYAFDEDTTENEDTIRRTIIPFQLAYAVSIHKAQGLEYNSVKVIIPNSNSEKITRSIFYTAITRAKKRLKIFWSSETMESIVSSFSSEQKGVKSLEIIKKRLI